MLTVSAALVAPAAEAAVPVTLKGSPASMERQHQVAKKAGLVFAGSRDDLEDLVDLGSLVPLDGNADYTFPDDYDGGAALPEVRLFIERLAAQYHAATGEQLVVTSLTRPQSRQPGNAHALSVHPAGMAIDLRVSRRKASRQWLEDTLLSLERKGVLDVTRERWPPHYHVALFPDPYLAHVEGLIGPEALAEALDPAPAEPALVASVDEALAAAPVERLAGEVTAEEAALSPAKDHGRPWMLVFTVPVVVVAVGLSILLG